MSKNFVITEALRDQIVSELDALSTTTCTGGQESAAELQSKLRSLKTVRKISDEMWDAMRDIDWRFRNGGGISFVEVNAKTVMRWCKTMGWDLPEGTEAHIKGDND